jgi:hypothetical protein
MTFKIGRYVHHDFSAAKDKYARMNHKVLHIQLGESYATLYNYANRLGSCEGQVGVKMVALTDQTSYAK